MQCLARLLVGLGTGDVGSGEWGPWGQAGQLMTDVPRSGRSVALRTTTDFGRIDFRVSDFGRPADHHGCHKSAIRTQGLPSQD
eukprot:scaffold154208_cov43-Prasinocladus_malaysianus.AAC.1